MSSQRPLGSRVRPLLVGLLLLIPGVGLAEETPGDEYAAGDYGRLRYQDNGVTLTRAETGLARDFPSNGDVNTPIFPGDAVTTAANQRAEVQLAGGSVVRIDEGSEVTFLALPDPYGEVVDDTVIQLTQGTLRIAALIGPEEGFRIDTPAATANVLGDADLRIEVHNDLTRIQSRRGVVEVVAADGAAVLRGGTATEIALGSRPTSPRPFNTFLADGFDHWVEDRESVYVVTSEAEGAEAYEAIPEEVQPYYRELSAYGNWVDTPDYGYVWYPRDVYPDWRPYAAGYWAYGPSGYFWVSSEPWGWAPYHYGRWTFGAGLGWGWIPGSVFGGAWVSWSWGSSYVGWSALDYWNYPVYHSYLYYGYYDPWAWTFVGYGHLNHHHHYHCSGGGHLDVEHVPDLDHASVVTRPPKVDPRRLSVSNEARQEALAEVRDRRMAPAPAGADARARNARAFRDSERRTEERRAAAPSREPTRSPSSRSLETQRQLSSRTVRRTAPGTTPDPAAAADQGPDARSIRDIYRRGAQPRPTRTPAETSPGAVATDSEAPADTPAKPQEQPRSGATDRPQTGSTRGAKSGSKGASSEPPRSSESAPDRRAPNQARTSPASSTLAMVRPTPTARSSTSSRTPATVRPQTPQVRRTATVRRSPTSRTPATARPQTPQVRRTATVRSSPTSRASATARPSTPQARPAPTARSSGPSRAPATARPSTPTAGRSQAGSHSGGRSSSGGRSRSR